MENCLKILIVEDSRDDVDLIERELKKGEIDFISLVVTEKEEFKKALSEFQPDVVLSDHSLPSFNSIEALQLFKNHKQTHKRSVPFILVTGTVSEDFSVLSIIAGADDYILKDRLKRLPTSIKSALKKCRIENEWTDYVTKAIESEALMKEAESLAHFGSWQADLSTGIYKWSDEVFRIYGYEPHEIEPNYEVFLRHVHPDDLFSIKNGRDHLINHLDWNENEFRIIDKSGKLKHLASKIVVKRNEKNQAIGFVGFNLDITQRKQAEERLQKSEQEYKSLFDQNPDAVYSLDLDGKFTKVNDGLVRLSGLTEAQLLGLNFNLFVAKSDALKVNGHFQSAIKGQPQRYETRVAVDEGKEYMLDVTNMPIIVNDAIIGVHGVAKNITEKKKLEALLDRVYRIAMIGGWEIDVPGAKVTWTEITKELHEVPQDYVPDLRTGISFYKEGVSRDTILKVLTDALDNGQPFDVELEIITAKGNLRWIRAIGEAEFRDGKCLRLYGSFQDIHERKKAAEDIKRSYQEKIGILESIGDAFFAVDKQWTITYWNNMAAASLRRSSEDVVGKNLWEVYADAVPLAFYEQYHKAMNENIPVHFQEYYHGQKIWVDVSAYPSEGGLSIYFRDITELRRHTEEIEEQNIRLKEIAWIQSHEVRAPLARMMGLIHLINSYPDQEIDLFDMLRHISNSARELDSIVKKIVRKTEELSLGPGDLS